MADGNAAGVTGEAKGVAAADHACRDGRRTAIGSLDLLLQLAEGDAGGRQAAVAARAVSVDVDGELERLATARSGAV